MVRSAPEAPLRATSSKSQPPHLVLDSHNNYHIQNLSFDHLLSGVIRTLVRNPPVRQPARKGVPRVPLPHTHHRSRRCSVVDFGFDDGNRYKARDRGRHTSPALPPLPHGKHFSL